MQLIFKRAMDVVVAATLLALLCVPLLALAALVRIKLGSPIFFRQTRIGLHEKPFDLIKFRTMTNACDANGQLLADEIRLTPFGLWLRSTSLDELPELWNILAGRMSLVGPRPLLPEYLPYYRAEEKLRHTMRPGITGLAQVNGRNALSWDSRLAFDVDYVKKFSLALDAQILWRTVKVVLQRDGISAEGQATMQRLDVERKN